MERQRLLEGWNQMRQLLPADAPPIQVREMKRAFYAGATTFYGILMNHMSGGDVDVVTQGDLDMMAALHNEIVEFQKRVRIGQE
jgi:hypothetical protein